VTKRVFDKNVAEYCFILLQISYPVPVHTLYRTEHIQTLETDTSFRYSLHERLASTVAVVEP